MLALARALVTCPRVLLIDEMSLGLAPLVVEALLPVIRTAAEEHGAAVPPVEHTPPPHSRWPTGRWSGGAA